MSLSLSFLAPSSTCTAPEKTMHQNSNDKLVHTVKGRSTALGRTSQSYISTLFVMRNKDNTKQKTQHAYSVLLLRDFMCRHVKVTSHSINTQIYAASALQLSSYHIHSFVAQVNWCVRDSFRLCCSLFHHALAKSQVWLKEHFYRNGWRCLTSCVHSQQRLGIRDGYTLGFIPLKEQATCILYFPVKKKKKKLKGKTYILRGMSFSQ